VRKCHVGIGHREQCLVSDLAASGGLDPAFTSIFAKGQNRDPNLGIGFEHAVPTLPLNCAMQNSD
jgi:hypothetical protein